MMVKTLKKTHKDGVIIDKVNENLEKLDEEIGEDNKILEKYKSNHI